MIKMFILENISSDFVNALIAITVGIIIYYAWKSTNVREDRLPPATLVIIENNRRRLLDNIVRPPTNIVRTPSTHSTESNVTAEIEVETENQEQSASTTTVNDIQIPTAPSLQAIIDEVNDLASARNIESHYRSVEANLNELFDTDLGPQQIINEMDNPDVIVSVEGLRRRRLAFYTGEGAGVAQSTEGASDQQQSSQRPSSRRENLNLQIGDNFDTSHAENCSNENNENENISKTENKASSSVDSAPADNCQKDTNDEVKDEFRIKLKYLNDELRLVKGSPNEAIGDFKKRNFTVELAAQKLVRLVFNGHVLQPDSKTLKACGLFDNCVVHCLIHNRKPSSSASSTLGGQEGIRNNQNRSQPNIQQGRSEPVTFFERNISGPTLIHLGIAMIALILILSWYCRVQYSYLFSWYSTIGLVLMTVLFLVISPLIILIEGEVTT